MIKLDILSDPICPWCYIGWTNLARALDARPDHPFAIEWHPFQLNPDMPAGGMDRQTYLQTKFGSKDGLYKAYQPVVEHAEKAGLALNLDLIARTPNTLDAHRLIHWAGIEGRQTPVMLALFRAYFIEGRDIGDAATLADIAAGVGLDRAMTETLLAGPADADDIRARDAHARARGVTGVPTFVIAGSHVLTGAQQTEVWLSVIDQIAAQIADELVGPTTGQPQ
jgi:predicted DsbA family dithiol-disulfide isomerase